MKFFSKSTWLVGCIASVSVASSFAIGEDWTRFRGPNGSGISASDSAPTTWNEKSNVKWSIDLPGPGSSCPIVLGDRVYVTCYSGFGLNPDDPGKASELRRHVVCVDRSSGASIWTTPIDSTNDEDPYSGFITEHGYASSTPATDGKHIYVLCGKTGLVALNMDGKEVWRRPLGTKSDPAHWGVDGASPIVYKDLVIANVGNTDNALVALNKLTGEVVWRKEDAQWTNNWTTPIIVELKERDELVFSAPGAIISFDPATGEELWRADSPILQTVSASLAQNRDVVFLMGGRAGDAIAVRCGGTGDVSKSNTLWKASLRSGIGTPVVVNNRLYWTSRKTAYCADCATGMSLFNAPIDRPLNTSKGGEARGPAGDYASPVVIGNKILVLLRSGEAQFMNASDKYEPVANSMFTTDPGPFNATPAVSNNQIFIRSNEKLYCIGG
jgi:outer membrane protein assembly factor BamB